MPRGIRKTINYEEEIMKTQAKITMHTNSISELREHLKQLTSQKEQEDLRALQTAIRNSGRTIEEVISSLT
ncbi:MAG: hypothetical protein HFJ84_10425 [Clostridiales bacterium]|jgi:hypothetical protein|nr:hypothetical protein [Clostridiales bacterium]